MTRGKHARSVQHRTIEELEERCATLEAEVERLRSVENVAALHVAALGRIEALSARLNKLDGVDRELERTRRMLERRTEQLEESKGNEAKMREAQDKMIDALLRFKPTGVPALSWLLSQFDGKTKFVVEAGDHADRIYRIAEKLGVEVKDLPLALTRPI